MMYDDLHYNENSYRQNEHRKARTKKLLDGITAYGFTELMKSNSDQEKLHRIVRVATSFEDEYEKMGGDL